MHSEVPVYPFCAVVGQERAKKALLMHAVNPSLKSVLLAGEPGTSKTTLVRGFAALLPERKRMVIPLHVDDERLLGGIETAAAVRFGEKRWSPGLLTEADGQIVTIDDANRMSERTLNAILSVAENGGRETERGGSSGWQPSTFLLIGTMNPHEGKLNPAMLDSWGLYVRVGTAAEPGERAEVMRRRFEFERDPGGFARDFEPQSRALREKLMQARQRLSAVRIGEPMLRLAAEIAAEAGCSGHRADILLAELARTLAAWDGEPETSAGHLREAAEFVLPHRMRSVGKDSARREASGTDREPADGGSEPARQPSKPDSFGPGSGPLLDSPYRSGENEERGEGGEGGERGKSDEGRSFARRSENGAASGKEDVSGTAAVAIVEAVGRDFDVRRIAFAPSRARFPARAGKRNHAGEGSRVGRYVRAEKPRGAIADLALDATLRAAAPFQDVRRRRQSPDGAEDGSRRSMRVERGDLRVKVRESRTGTALLFVVDASGSMNAAKRMKAVKGAVLSLLRDAYRQRDSVGLIAFRDRGAELLLDITRSVELAERRLRSMPVGGKTPLLAGLEKGAETIGAMRRKGSGLVPAMIVITDGKANAGGGSGRDPWPEIRSACRRISAAGIRALVIDTEQGFVRLGYARKLADCLQAQYCRLEELEAGRIEKAARGLARERQER